MSLADLVRENLQHTVNLTDFSALGEKYQGKVRDCYMADGKRYIIVTDRISAFDRVLTTLPFKGQLLNRMSSYWFETTKDIAPNHVIEVPDPQVTVAHECEPLPVEMVVRSYLTGVTNTSIWTAYERGDREFCGHALPDGMVKNQKLPETIITPSTKETGSSHDRSVSRDELIAEGWISEADFDHCAQMALNMFAEGQKRCAERGLILVDTKYELGRLPDGTICFIDEVHTPDSSRFWMLDSYEDRLKAGEAPESLDKEYVRTFLAREHNYKGDGPVPPIPDDVRVEAVVRYAKAFEMITGTEFIPDTTPPSERIGKNLGLA